MKYQQDLQNLLLHSDVIDNMQKHDELRQALESECLSSLKASERTQTFAYSINVTTGTIESRFPKWRVVSCNCYRVRTRVCVANFKSRDCPRGRENILLRTRRHFHIYEDFKCDLYHDVKDVRNLRFARNRCLPFL